MESTAERIRKGMELRELTQSDIVKRTGISKGALSSYLSGKYVPKQNNIYLIAKALNVNEAWLMGADVPMSRMNANTETCSYKIPVLGRVAAGIPLEAIEDIIDYEEIPEELAKTGEFFGLKIKGDSMEPRIKEGDVVIVRKQDDAETGDIIVALINGDDATCKRLKKYADGIMLLSNNPVYEPFIFNYNEVHEKPVHIIGKVIELRGKL